MPEQQQSEKVSLDDFQAERLPPALEQFLGKLKADKKKLMKDKAFKADPDQQRRFLGLYLYPSLEGMFRMLAGLALEAYGLAASNTNELRRLHGFVVEELNDLGADLPDDMGVPGVSPAVLDQFQQAFYALGSLLQEKVPDDPELEQSFNKCAEALSEVVGELMGSSRRYYDDDDDDRDDDDRDDDDDRGDKPKGDEAEVKGDGETDKPDASTSESPPAEEDAEQGEKD